ncbi:MAG: hypothetical protein V3S64_16580 [bacterium]
MNLMHVQTEESYKNFQNTTLEDLVTSHFNSVYTILNVFVEDPRTCLHFTEGVFRTMDLEDDLTDKAVYRTMVKKIRRIPQKSQFLDGVPHENVLCWLLKETEDFRYAEIAGLMGMDREQVKLSIADVRGQLLS